MCPCLGQLHQPKIAPIFPRFVMPPTAACGHRLSHSCSYTSTLLPWTRRCILFANGGSKRSLLFEQGLHAGALITSIQGRKTASMSLRQAASWLRGPSGKGEHLGCCMGRLCGMVDGTCPMHRTSNPFTPNWSSSVNAFKLQASMERQSTMEGWDSPDLNVHKPS